MHQPDLSPEYRSLRGFLAPRYWPTWIALGLMKVVAHMSYPIQIKIGQLLGVMSYHLAWQRRHICEVNIHLCFPELNDAERKQLVRKTFISNAIGLIEVAIAWHRDPEEFRDRVTTCLLYTSPSPRD